MNINPDLPFYKGSFRELFSAMNAEEQASLTFVGSNSDRDKIQDAFKYLYGKPHPIKKKTKVVYFIVDLASVFAAIKTRDVSKIVLLKIGLVGEGVRPFGKRFSDYRIDDEPATLYMNDKSQRRTAMFAFETDRPSELEQLLISIHKEYMDGVAPPFCIKEGGTGRVSI